MAAAAAMFLALTALNPQASANPSAEDEPPAESTEQPSESTSISAVQVGALRKQVREMEDLDAEVRTRALDNIQKAEDAIERATRLETRTPTDIAAIKTVVTSLKDVQSALDRDDGDILAELSEDAVLSELLPALAARQPMLQEARNKLSAAEAEPGRRAERRTIIAGDLATHATRKADIQKELAAPNPADELPAAAAARRALLMARLREVEAQAPAWQAELSKYDAEQAVDLPSMRIRVARADVARLEAEVDELNRRITTKRSQDALYVAEQLHLFAEGNPKPSPYLQPSQILFEGRLKLPADLKQARETAELASTNLQVTKELAQATADLDTARTRLEKWRTERQGIDRKILRVGLTGAIGLDLRRQLRDLDDPGIIRNECRVRQQKMRDLEFKRFDIEDKIPTIREQIDQLKQENPESDSGSIELRQPDAGPPSIDQRKEAGRESGSSSIQLRLTSDRFTALTALEKNYGELFNRLGDLDAIEQESIRTLEEFDAFVRERVLWIKSHQLLNLDDASAATKTARWLTAPTHWIGVASSVFDDVNSNRTLYLIYGALAILLLSVQRRFRRNLTAVGEVAARPACRQFHPTARATVLTVVLSIAWPIVPGFFAWRLLASLEVGDFPRACGHGLLALTAAFFTLNLLRNLCRPSGLGLSHFAWPSNPVHELRPQIYSLMILLLPIIFLENLLHTVEQNQSRDALERVLFIVSLTILAYFQWKVLHPTTGAFREFVASRSSHWAYRIRWPFFWLAVGVPLALALLAVIGFFYTAYELSWRLHVSTWALIGLFVARSFLIRWYIVRHRELRIEQARQKRRALAEQSDGEETSNLPKKIAGDSEVDLREVSRQTRGLINSGLFIVGLVVTWFVWVDVLPALGILDQWTLWDTTVDVTVNSADGDEVKTFRTEQRIEPVTFADALIAIVIGLITMTAGRNIPGLLEISLLNKLPLEPATRYAVKMIARYLIIVIGTVMAFNAIGIGWAKVQWLAAALTVGLGFGLQEIFANFVSGLIILFERPVRIGDVVTISDVSGVVSRIQIRATTITDWDRKEYIVPNREFVTGRLLNWTLSDKTNRVVIDVGIAYGDDTQLARELLLKVAADHPDVLEDPSPIATFEQFGDSTLNLKLRCYLPNLDNRLRSITELHEGIDRAFKAASIEIAFPQQDLHIRTMSGSEAGDKQD